MQEINHLKSKFEKMQISENEKVDLIVAPKAEKYDEATDDLKSNFSNVDL